MPLLTRAARAASRNRHENDAPGTPQKAPHSHKKGSPATSSPKKLLKKAPRRDKVFHIQQASKHRQILADRSATLNIVRTQKTRHQLRFHPVVTGHVCYLEDVDPSEDEGALDKPGNVEGVHSVKARCAGSIIFTSSNEHQQQTYPRGILRVQRPAIYLELPEDTRSQDGSSPQEARGRAGTRARSLNSRSPAPPPTSNANLRSSSVDTERPHATRSGSTRARPRLRVTPVDLNVARGELSLLSPTLVSSNSASTADPATVPPPVSRTPRVADLSSDDSDDEHCVYRSLFETPSLPASAAAAGPQSAVTVPCNATTSTHSRSVADCKQDDASDEIRSTDMTGLAKGRLDARASHANGARFELPRNRVDRVLLWFSLVYFPIALAMLGRIFGLV